jgi:hypothetical protein
MIQLCTTWKCEEEQMMGGLHPSGLCMTCYQKHKQDLRDGKELME